MTTNTIEPLENYVEDGVTTIHAIPFKFLADSDLVVDRTAAGVVTVLELGTDYTVTGAGEAEGGSLVKSDGGTAGARLRIRRRTSRAQGMDYTPNDTFQAESHEAALDRQSLVNEEQDVEIASLGARAPQVPDGEAIANLPDALTRAARVLGFDNSGDPLAGPLIANLELLVSTALSSLQIGPAHSIANVAGMQALLKPTLTDGDTIELLGFGDAFDGGGGLFRWIEGDLTAEDGGTVFAAAAGGAGRWKRIFRGMISVKWFGVKGDGATNDTVNFQKAIDYVEANGGTLWIPTLTYLVSTLAWSGSNYSVSVDGALFKQVAGLTGDALFHPIWAVTGEAIAFGRLARFEGNIASDQDEYSPGVAIGPAKRCTFGRIHGENLRGDVVYIYGRISSEAEMTRGIVIDEVTGDNVLRCLVAITGGQGHIGSIRRTGTMRLGYKDLDAEPNAVVGTSGDYQPVEFTFGHGYGAQFQLVSADDDVINKSLVFQGGLDLDGDRIANSDPPYSGFAGTTDFAVSVSNSRSVDVGDLVMANYDFSPILLSNGVGRFGYRTIRFANVTRTDTTYKTVILHLGTDRPKVVEGGLIMGALFDNTRMLFRSDSQFLNLDVGKIDVTGGLFGARVTGHVEQMTLDCGDSAGEIVFNNCDGMDIGTTVISNAANAYGFYDCNNFKLTDWVADFGAGLDYTGISTNFIAHNCALNGDLVPGFNLLFGAEISVNGVKVLGAQQAALGHAANAAAAPTQAEFNALVAAHNALVDTLGQSGMGITADA